MPTIARAAPPAPFAPMRVRRVNRSGRQSPKASRLPERSARNSCGAFGNVIAHHAFITLQPPLMVRTIGEPIGDPNLRIDLAGSHGDARLLTGGNDFLQAELAVAENRDKSNEHGGLHE